MKHSLLGAMILCFALSFSAGGCSRKEEPVSTGAGARELAEHTAEFKKDIITVTDGVYVAVGYGLANSILLVGKDGTVVVDVMESMEAAVPVKKAFDGISRKPLKAVIFTHFHTDHVSGAEAFTGDRNVDIYSHEKTLEELDRVATLTQEITYRRSMRMFGTFLPKEDFANCGIGPFLTFNDRTTFSYRRPNRTFPGDRVKIKIAGLNIELIHAPGETDDQIVVWLPDKKVLVAADNYYKSFPNLYTIRGTRYRDVQVWARSLEKMRKLQAEYLVPCHTRPVTGRERIDEVLADYRDAIQSVHDQTVRGINKGLTPDEIVRSVKLPPHLAEKPYLREYYGTVAWSARNIFNGYLGWFSGDSADLNPLSPEERAGRMAALSGGKKALLGHARKALKDGDLQWALELSGNLLRLDPGRSDAMEIRTSALRAIAGASGNANEKNYYSSQALEAEGKLSLKGVKITRRLAHRVPLAAIFSAMGARLNPERSKDIVRTVGFRFPDTREAFTVQVRRGVAFIEPVFPNKADITVTVNSNTWKEIVTKLANPAVALAKGDVKIEGGIVNLVKFLNLFSD
jgi:alkyl sulfatase BDS1-like metallo-beta-lactamase superfamily hydrolase